MKRLFILISFVSAAIISGRSDIITTTSGRQIHGTIIQTNANEVLVLADYGATTLPANIVQKIAVEMDKHPTTLSTNRISSPGRLPNWKLIITQLAAQVWAEKLRQIPATVITNGILKNVPYISFRCGIDYEINVYGDLDNPAGIEIGIYRSLLSKSYAKEHVIKFMGSLLVKESDRNILTKLNIEKDFVHNEGLVLEVTPPSAEDSYGGWWISAYDERALDQARASDDELKSISVMNSSVIRIDSNISENTWTKDDLKYARPSVGALPAAQSASPPSNPITVSSAPSSDVASGHDRGSTYVRGYYKRNGSYVHPHTRR